MNFRAVWDDDQASDSHEPQLATPKQKQRGRYSTDVIEWLELNEPEHFDDLMDLRKTLYSRKCNFGKFFITKRGQTSLGEERFVLNGPASAVLILSNRCRHFLLRTLNRLRRQKRWPPIAYQ